MIWANSIGGIVANGIMTTGQVNMGSATASDLSNHNVTRLGDTAFNEPFTAKPDSIAFWAKFVCDSAVQFAKMSAIIHDSSEYQDPGGNVSNEVAKAVLDTISQGDWQRYVVPFTDVNATLNPAFILISFTTNAVPGKGGSGDTLWIDDVEMIYNQPTPPLTGEKLSFILIDSDTLEGFDPDNPTYTVASASCTTFPNVTAEAENPANVDVTTVQATPESKQAVITVVDKADTTNVNTYTITFTTPEGSRDTVYGDTTYTETFTNVDGCDSIIVHLLTVGIVQINTEANTVSVYPNPAQTFINIQSASVVSDVELYDIAGRLVKKETNLGQYQLRLDLNNLSKGVYSVKVTTEKGIISKKVVLH
jgi:hypothetical protein